MYWRKQYILKCSNLSEIHNLYVCTCMTLMQLNCERYI